MLSRPSSGRARSRWRSARQRSRVAKYSRSRMSITPLAIEPKCVRNDSEAIASITGCGAQPSNSVEHQRKPDSRNRKQIDDGEDERDHLVARRRRQARADREEAAGHQQAADVGGEDRAVVGVAEVVDGDPHRERQRERDAREAHAARNLPSTACQGVIGSVISSSMRAGLALLGPQPHRQRRDQEQVQPRVIVEERREVGLAALVEAAEVERERRRRAPGR